MSGDKAVLRNDEGAPVQLGNDRFGKVGSPNYGGNKIYCGRNEKQCGKIRGSNGDCGPSGGPQCNSCSRLQAKLYNDEGVRVRLGNDKFGPPGSANYGGDKWYCGRSMFIPGTDGQCGPSGGNQCPSCTRFQKDPLGTMAMLQSKLSTAPSAPPPPQPPAAKPAAANAKLAAGAPIKATNGWSSFISYKQDDQNDGLVLLTMQQLPGGSESNWVDKFANDRSTEGMMAGVKAADVFIAVLSPKYFGSKFCCMELDHAIACKKKMCLCYNMSKHTVQSALNWVPDELKFLLKGEVLPLHEDVQFATACIQRITSAKILQAALSRAAVWRVVPEVTLIALGRSTARRLRSPSTTART